MKTERTGRYGLLVLIVTLCFCLGFATQSRSENLEDSESAIGRVRDSQPRSGELPSNDRWYLDVAEARRAAEVAGMPLMIVFR